MAKVIVFGGAGFLGSHVADELTARGHEVAIFDQRPSPYLRKDQRMIVDDITNDKAIQVAIKGTEYVFHFAGIADIQAAKERHLDAINGNILGTVKILEACRLQGVKRFLFASSLYVYSNVGSFYRATKQCCEILIEEYHKEFGLNYTILRYGSLYGPRADENNWIAKILKQALLEGKITRGGSGDEIREYIHVLDAARCTVDALSSDYENQSLIITGYQSLKIRECMQMINEILGRKIELEFLPTREELHYDMTPYSFTPKIARRMVSNFYLDFGQGILETLNELYHRLEIHPPKK
jgi:UDP-glucose 4-epimerase